MIRPLFLVFGLPLVLCACNATESVAVDSQDVQEMRSLNTVSYDECRKATIAAVQDAMINSDFNAFLDSYKSHASQQSTRPLLMVWKIKNNTNDPEFDVGLVTDEFCTALRNAGKVRVSMATGIYASTAPAAIRELRNDPNFRKESVKALGTLNAPDLSLEGQVIANRVSDGNRTVQVYSFNLKIQDLATGEEVWSYNKAFATQKTRAIFGW